MIDTTRAGRNLAIFAALFAGGATPSAAQVPMEGSYEFTACWSGASNVIAFSKRHTAFTYEMTGTTRASQPGAIFDKNAFRCIGINMIFDGKVTGTVVCEGVDADGHKILSKYDVAGPSARRTTLEGTGKYEGIAMIAEPTKPLGPFPTVKAGTFQNCNQQTGTYKLMKKMN